MSKRAMAVLTVVMMASAGTAATFTVNNSGDAGDANPGDGVARTTSGVTTLRAAIEESNALDGADTIEFSSSITGTIETDTFYRFRSPITINGPGADVLTLRVNDEQRCFRVFFDGDVTIRDVTLEAGDTGLPSPRQVVFNSGGVLRMERVVVTGGDYDFNGGGIETDGDLFLDECHITGNVSSVGGGGLFVALGGGATVRRSSFTGNAALNGGGLFNNGNTTVVNTTFAENSAAGNGGGLYNVTDADLALINCTVAYNRITGFADLPLPGAGITGNTFSDTLLHNTIVANNIYAFGGASDPIDIVGDIATLGHNVIGARGVVFGISDGEENDLAGSVDNPLDAGLRPVVRVGAATPFVPITAASPAYDSGDSAAVTSPAFAGPPFLDQRGFARIDGAAVDRGAFEVEEQPSIWAVTGDQGTSSSGSP